MQFTKQLEIKISITTRQFTPTACVVTTVYVDVRLINIFTQ